MAGTASPGSSSGPTFAPPPLPPGWIAQWDAVSGKYYFVQLSTGVSQWDTPTESAPTGLDTPAPPSEHPYGAPGPGGAQIITHPDGTRTVKHPDGTMEPILPGQEPGTRGVGGPGDRGLGVSLMQS